ncbi:PTS sugar transporter subunit IIA [Enterococcus alishanensis]|uniref:PTS sugar transporter subunit IIA n=1 Tax=Enterococcus alishanensis TaxID=1303817 RepID=A0ABS6TB28_9ENTE|nr:PTS sugar transporter subunit IIA [Enterococcus alishanensis]MBV7390111.1 PTS sugar transporter subunit IIA [Enterococcus alishanensis]
MNKNIILMSHGKMAEETLNSAKMIVGDMLDYPVVSMASQDGIEGTIEKLNQALKKYERSTEILVIVDLLGGTPGNAALLKAHEDPRISVLTGLNLAMLLESISLPPENLADNLKEIGQNSIQIPSDNKLNEDDE